MGSSPTLLSLGSDLLRAIANKLPPADRVALSHTCKALFAETWGGFGLGDLLARFPLEQRTTFGLSPGIPGLPAHLRAVPDRAAQQHVYAAVSADGRTAAVLPYDNVLRLVDVRSGRVAHAAPLRAPALYSDVWDLAEGFRRPTAAPDAGKRYADRAAVDAEAALEFSRCGRRLVLSCARFAHVYAVGGACALAPVLQLDAGPVLDALRAALPGPGGPADGAAGAAALAPDGRALAWVMFHGFPARVALTLWAIDPDAGSARWAAFADLGPAGAPSGSALAWARPAFDGDVVAVALNTTARQLVTERVGDAFRRAKLCRFRFAAVRVPPPAARGGSGGAAAPPGPAQVAPAAQRAAWLALSPERYPGELAAELNAVIAGAAAAAAAAGGGAGEEVRPPAAAFNGLHTSPSEATYKALSFGDRTKHPWFVAKQPLYSLHFCAPPPRAAPARRAQHRVLVAAAAHENSVTPLAWAPPPPGPPPSPPGSPVGVQAASAPAQAGAPAPRAGRFTEADAPGAGRRFAFRGLPWRAAFASVTAFAPGGRWIVGAALQADTCVVCVRNVTDLEYYGSIE